MLLIDGESPNNVYTIPYKLFVTNKDYDSIPDKAWRILQNYAEEYELLFFDNHQCEEFIKKHFTEIVSKKFNSLKIGRT